MVVDHDDDVAVGAAVPDLVLGGVGHVKVGEEGLATRAVLADIQGRHAAVLPWRKGLHFKFSQDNLSQLVQSYSSSQSQGLKNEAL